LIGLCTVGAFSLFSFLNIEMDNVLRLGSLKPTWAIFSAFSFAVLIASVGFVAHRQLGTTKDEVNLSILNVPAAPQVWFNAKRQGLFLLVSVALVAISVWWLRSIANHTTTR
jgi:hypothetical protein